MDQYIPMRSFMQQFFDDETTAANMRGSSAPVTNASSALCEGLTRALCSGVSVEEGVNFVIRLKQGSHPPKFRDAEGKEVVLSLSPGEKVSHSAVWCKGKVCVNLIGVWKKGLAEPLWVMTNLEAERAWRMYLSRMKIAQTFCDLKGLLGMNRLMNKRQENMEKMVAMLLLVYAIALLVGETCETACMGCRPSHRSAWMSFHPGSILDNSQ